METIHKSNSQNRVNILKMAPKGFLASFVCGEGFDQVLIAAEEFKTESGARRWAEKKLA